ncbi:RICIN domain-containing protein, partial [Streptococcus pneumoniae]|uniref:RICIN domain-containing protein n=1 Tax=Streptococcus pneumoniae TaxID=1313 RepID=UPI0011BACD89
PRTLRLFFWCNGRNYERTIDIQQLRFYAGNVSAAEVTPTQTGPTAGKTYYIKAKQSDKNVDVSGQSTADGAAIIQWAY